MNFIGAIVFAAVLLGAWAGDVKALTSHPIVLSSTNAGENSSYTFHFQPETLLAPGLSVVVRFPRSQYDAGLGVTKCQAYFSPEYIVPCSVSGVSVTVDIGRNVPEDDKYSLTLLNVTNPSQSCTTSHFALEIFKGPFSLDFTDLFGQVAIAPPHTPMTAPTITCSAPCNTGEFSDYEVRFTPTVQVKKEHRVVLEVPAGFEWAGRCIVEKWAKLQCVKTGDRVRVLGMELGVQPGETVVMGFHRVRNPLADGPYGPFSLQILEEFSNTLLSRSPASPGPSILPSPLTIDQVCPSIQSTFCLSSEPSLIEDSTLIFTLSARTANLIPETGVLVVEFSSEFQQAEGCNVVSGLGERGVECTVEGKKAVFRPGGSVKKGTLVVQVRIRTPKGLAGSVLLSTYSDSSLSHLIDQTPSPTPIPLSPVRKMTLLSLYWSNELRAGGHSLLSLIFQPSMNFTKVANGRVRIRLPSDCGVQLIGSPTLDICEFSVLQTSFNSSWSSNANLVDIPFVAGPQLVPSSCSSSISVTAGGSEMTLPSSPGDYPFEVLLNDGPSDIEAAIVWVTVGPQAFSEGRVESLLWEAGVETVVEIKFKTTDVSAGGGVVVVEFEGAGWERDLGTGVEDGEAMACREQSNQFPNDTLTCVLSHGTPTSLPSLRISPFRELKPKSDTILELSGLKTPSSLSKQAVLRVSTFALIKNKQTPLNSDTFPFPETRFIQTVTSETALTSLVLSPNSLRTVASLKVTIATDMKIQANSRAVVRFPKGFAFAEKAITCKVNDKPTLCAGFSISGVVIADLFETTGQTPQILTINGVITPRHVLEPTFLILDIVSAHETKKRIVFPDFPRLKPGEIANAAVTIDSNEADNLDTTYFFVFDIENPLWFEGKIRLGFPSEYTLATSKLRCSVDGSPLFCHSDENSVLISTLSAKEHSSLTLKLTHLANPSTVGWTSDFAIETYSDSGLLIDTNTNVPGVSITPKVAKVPLLHLSLRLSPNNRNFVGDMTMIFLPSLNLPEGTVIEVHFPGDYLRIPQEPECELTGGGLSTRNCTAVNSVLSITTDSPYLRGIRPAPITVSLKRLRSVDPPSVSSPLVLKLYYSGSLIDESPPVPANRTLTFAPEPLPVSVLYFDYSPKTASEEAIYQFTVRPDSDFAANCSFGIRFGEQFPRRLNRAVQCFAMEIAHGNDGRVDCFEVNRTIVLGNTKGWRKADSGNFTVIIQRIVNPSAGTSIGPIDFFSQCGDTVLDFATYSTAHTPALTPHPLVLVGFNTTSVKTGETADVSLAAVVVGVLPQCQQDLILIDFPSEFDLDFVQSGLACQSSLYSTPSGVPCEYNLARVSIAAFPPSFQGAGDGRYQVAVLKIENPWEAGEIVYPTLSIHDSHDDTIVAKTSQNLANLPSLSYQKSMLNIEVNQNRAWVQNKGTRSDFISVCLETLAPQAFSISQKNYIQGVTVSPFAIEFEKGTKETKFRVTIAQSAVKGNYTMEWNVNGAWSTPLYVPRRFTLVITDLGNEQIMVQPSDNVVQGGLSDPSNIALQHAPAAELSLRFVKLSPQPTALRFVPEVLKFGPEDVIKSFTIEVAEDSFGDMGEFFIYKEGENANSYFLPRSVFSFKVIPREDSPPRITDLKAVAVTRTSAKYRAVTDKPTTLYWMVTWFGARVPSEEEIRERRFNATVWEEPKYERSVAGNAVMPRHFEYEMEVEGLRAQMRYIVYVFNENGPENSKWLKSNFTTVRYFRSAYATIKFKTGSLPESEKNAFLDAAAKSLSVSKERLHLLEESKLNGTIPTLPGTTSKHPGRTSLTFLHLVLETDPYYPGQVSPAEVLTSLKTEKLILKASSISFDEGGEIVVKELEASVPVWKGKVVVGEVTKESVRLDNVLLEGKGRIFMCVLQSEKQPAVPLSYQIYKGVDFFNEECWSNTNFTTSPLESSVQITPLDSNSTYWVFLSASNSLPLLPDLMQDSHVAVLSFHTPSSPSVPQFANEGLAGCLQLALIVAAPVLL